MHSFDADDENDADDDSGDNDVDLQCSRVCVCATCCVQVEAETVEPGDGWRGWLRWSLLSERTSPALSDVESFFAHKRARYTHSTAAQSGGRRPMFALFDIHTHTHTLAQRSAAVLV